MKTTKRRANGEGSVYFVEKEQKWRAEIAWIDNKGNQQRKSWKSKKQSEVKAKLVEFKKQLLLNGTETKTDDRTFRQFADEWVNVIVKPKVKPLSYQRKVSTLENQVYDANGTEEDDWRCNYIEVVVSVRQADWITNRVSFNGHSYYVFDLSEVTDYAQAMEYCRSLGGYMATITSQEENDFLYAYIKSLGYKNAYFGLSDAAREDTWVWSNGEVFAYSNWAPGEPNSSKEDYAMFYSKYSDGKWNDGSFGKGSVFICEWDSYK